MTNSIPPNFPVSPISFEQSSSHTSSEPVPENSSQVSMEKIAPNQGRNTFIYQLKQTKIPRNKTISDANRDENLQQGLARVSELFKNKSSEEEEADHTGSSKRITDYIEANERFTELPQNIRQDLCNLMIEFDKVTQDIPKGFPYGRGNILRRKIDENGALVVDQNSTLGKARLMLLAEDIYPEIAAKRNERTLQLSTKIAALGILTGAGSCANYTHTLALLAAFRINKSSNFKGKVRFEICNMPYRKGRRVDHVYGIAHYKAEDGNEYKLLLDPSADRDQVQIPNFSELDQPVSTYDIDYFGKVDEDTRDLIVAHMKVSSDRYIQSVYSNSGHQKKVEDTETLLLDKYNPDERYDLNNTLAGRVDTPFDNTKPDIVKTSTRRMSFIDPADSPLLRTDQNLPQQIDTSGN